MCDINFKQWQFKSFSFGLHNTRNFVVFGQNFFHFIRLI